MLCVIISQNHCLIILVIIVISSLEVCLFNILGLSMLFPILSLFSTCAIEDHEGSW